MLNNFNNSKFISNTLVFRRNRLCPAGTVESFAGLVAPSGWLLCDGSIISRTQYPVLFEAIGTTHGAGDGVTTFRLPDMRSRVSVAAGPGVGLSNRGVGEVGGAETHTLSIAEMPAHTHPYVDTYRTGNQNNDNAFNTETSANETTTNENKTTGSTGGGLPHNNMQPFIVLNHIIKF